MLDRRQPGESFEDFAWRITDPITKRSMLEGRPYDANGVLLQAGDSVESVEHGARGLVSKAGVQIAEDDVAYPHVVSVRVTERGRGPAPAGGGYRGCSTLWRKL